MTKSTALPINIPPASCETLRGSFPFHWSNNKIPYLGIFITPQFSSIFAANYPTCVSRLQNLLNTWSSYRISFLGRVVAVKMTLLPKLLFIFRSLLINIPKTYIDKLQQEVNRFIWQNKRPRFSKHILYKCQSTGGLGLPNFWFYFLAALFSQIAQWNIPDSKVPWVGFESDSILPYYLSSILWSPSNVTYKLTPLNSIVFHSLRLWHSYKNRLGLISPAPPGSSFLEEPLFTLAFNHPENFA